MRIPMTLTALSILAFTASAQAQSPSPGPQRGPAEAPASDSRAMPRLTKVEIVEFSELPPRTQNQVDAVIATTKQEDLQKLHQSIDAIPEATAAMKAKGVNTSQIVVASLDEQGTLTLITKAS